MTRPSTAAPILAVLAIALPMIYVVGYFLIPETSDRNLPLIGTATIRVFDASWQARIYWPMAKIEESISGQQIVLSYDH